MAKPIYVLGINAYDHDVAACLLRDGEVAYAIEKERITRQKHATGFFQEVVDYVLKAEGILSVIPEYNGSFPGIYKLFIDMLKFPESLVDVPAGFIGVSSGEWGALRPVEHAQMVFQYRHAPLYGRRIFLKSTRDTLDAEGRPRDPALAQRFEDFLQGFLVFCRKNKA